jgi:hypothetical protein
VGCKRSGVWGGVGVRNGVSWDSVSGGGVGE